MLSKVTASRPRLDVSGLSKSFRGQRVLREAGLSIQPGELHGLVGQNGSGKSTLLKLLSGYHAPDRGGSVLIDGEPLRLPVDPGEARRRGMSVVHQGLGLVDSETVLENIRLGRCRPRRLTRRISWAAERERAADALTRLGCSVDLQSRAGALSAEARATVAIARALQDHQPGQGLILFDECTRALTRTSLAHFYRLVETVLADGAAVLLVSHRLEEILDVADRVTVLRDGEVVESGVVASSLTESALTKLMLGRDLAGPAGRPGWRSASPRPGATPGPASVAPGPAPLAPGAAATVTVTGLSGEIVRDLDLSLGAGEIIGVTGLTGSGFEEVPYLLAGARRAGSGTLEIGGRTLRLAESDCLDHLDAGVALVPEERDPDGLALELSVAENLGLLQVRRRGSALHLGRRWQGEVARTLIEQVDVTPPRPDVPVSTLSGGNQQKVLLAKWLAAEPALLLLHEPTQAVDVGARHRILAAIQAEAARGCCVLLATSDEQELSNLCDRILVFREGRPDTWLPGRLSPDEIMAATMQGDRLPLRDPARRATGL
jgi:ribose transport system ATP-binding protein